MLKKMVTGFALLLLTVIAVTQSIDVYSTHFSNDTDQFVVRSTGVWKDPPGGVPLWVVARDGGDTSAYRCDSHALESPCGYVSYLDSAGQETTIYLDEWKRYWSDDLTDSLGFKPLGVASTRSTTG